MCNQDDKPADVELSTDERKRLEELKRQEPGQETAQGADTLADR
jgi:hypothetical protein